MQAFPELLNTDEAARYLRLSERKLYELVANGAVPCTKVTGRWLFPKVALDHWVAAGLPRHAAPADPAPPIIGGSHDPLLEWALRESRSGLATLPEGSESGLRRLARGEVVAAAIHLHRIEGDDDASNVEAVASAPGLQDTVLIAFARREQGLLVAPGNPLKLATIADVLGKRARIALRPKGAGAQLLLLSLLHRAKADIEQLNAAPTPAPTGPDIAQAIRAGRADVGVATRSVAQAAGLDFVPLIWEAFDLVVRQRDYFHPPLQKLFTFLRSDVLAARAKEMGGFDLSAAGSVRFVN